MTVIFLQRLTEEEHEAIMLMAEMGGSFAKQLAQAWIHADIDNQSRLKAAFPELLAQYMRQAQRKRLQASLSGDHRRKVITEAMRNHVVFDDVYMPALAHAIETGNADDAFAILNQGIDEFVEQQAEDAKEEARQ